MAGYKMHLVSAASEWVLVILFTLFFASFAAELKHFEVELRLSAKREGPSTFLLLDDEGAEVAELEDSDTSMPAVLTEMASGSDYGGLRDSLLA